MTRVGIIETGTAPDAELHSFGSASHQFERYFADGHFQFERFPIFANAPLPTVRHCDSWIITGSTSSVYESLSWIAGLMDFVRRAVGDKVPVLGICFGHQLMSAAFGGEVQRAKQGRGIGLHRHRLTEAGKKVFGPLVHMSMAAAHQDQVIIPPKESISLATSEFCPHASFWIGASGLTLQGHPEMVPDCIRYVVDAWQKSSPVDDERYNKAVKSLDEGTFDSNRIQPVLAAFLHGKTLAATTAVSG